MKVIWLTNLLTLSIPDEGYSLSKCHIPQFVIINAVTRTFLRDEKRDKSCRLIGDNQIYVLTLFPDNIMFILGNKFSINLFEFQGELIILL